MIRQSIQKVSDRNVKLALVVGLIAFAVLMRLVPHPANFAPIGAIALFGGAILPRHLALSLPLAAMVISDFFIGMHPMIWYTWGSFLVIAFVSNRYLKEINPATLIGSSLAASIFFFVVTNFGVWAQGWLYPRTAEGLMQSYINAIPFFRNTLLGDIVYTSVLFGAYVVVYRYVLHQAGSLKLASTKSS